MPNLDSDKAKSGLLFAGAIALVLFAAALVGIDYQETRTAQRATSHTVTAHQQMLKSHSRQLDDIGETQKRFTESAERLTQALNDLRVEIASGRN